MKILSAATEISINPDLNKIFIPIMSLVFIALLIMVAWHFLPIFIANRRNKREENIKADNNIWFDEHKSMLHKGSRQKAIPESSLEYYVCKLVFANPKVYQSDWDVLQEAGEEDKKDRAVYFAVDRINNKARKKFKIEDKLLKRSKEKTRLNDIYF
jgi:hypothetical protein